MGMKDDKTVTLTPGSKASVEIAKDEDRKEKKPLRGLQAFRNA